MTGLALAIAVKGPWNAAALASALRAAGAMAPGVNVHLACDHPPTAAMEGIDVIVCSGVSLFRLWGIAAARCRAEHVAILHALSPPAPGWTGVVLAALRAGRAVCGPVEPGYAPHDPRIIAYLVEYCQFHRPVSPWLDEVPGNNLVLPRAMLPAPAVLDRDGFSKTDMLDAGRLHPTWVNEAVVQHRRDFALAAFCRRRYRHGRSYAAKRLAAPTVSRRALLTVFALALPLVRVARIWRHARRIPALRGAVIRRLPAMLLAEACWSLGEGIGYVTLRTGDPAQLD